MREESRDQPRTAGESRVGSELEGKSRIIARPSGTEPKIKFYFDVCEPMRDGQPLADAERRASDKMEQLKQAFTPIAGV